MKILSFAFNGEENNLYLPHNIEENSVCYTGTHDNDTLLGLIENASEWDKGNLYRGVRNSLERAGIDMLADTNEQLIDAIIELGFISKANTFILPLQDILKLNTDYRINEPGTVRDQNWAVRLEKSQFNLKVRNRLKTLTEKYHR